MNNPIAARTMEILIDVPPWLQPCVQWIGFLWAYLARGWAAGYSVTVNSYTVLQSSLHQLTSSNAFFPIMAILLVFWPILLTLIMTLATAWAWIFWLVTTLIFGVVQLGYVSYQFFMITLDISGLSLLKTYSMIRNQLLSLLELSTKGSLGTSRRQQWRKQLEECSCYEDFLKLRIDSKDESALLKSANTLLKQSKMDTALPDNMKRSQSFSLKTDGEQSPTRNIMKRNFSFNGKTETTSQPADEPIHKLSKYKVDPVVAEELGEKLADLLVTTTFRLKEARAAAPEESASSLKYLLSGVVKRNHLGLDDWLVENARVIADTGTYGLTASSRRLIRAYHQEVENGLTYLAESGLGADEQIELMDRITLFRKMKQNMGRTALMLSGGGAQAMYHLGVVKALIESKQYDNIKVISGTSGGSITAGMCAICKADELYEEVCVPWISTDFRRDGSMKKQNIRWFPSMTEMATFWLKCKLMVDSAEFRRTCEFYYRDITFEEAFERTGKHVCITVSASRASQGRGTAQRLLLNHISTPHVTIASAVAASCALPGVMKPAKLVAKSSTGELEPFEVDGVEWIDGSVQADLPFQRISTLFAVSSFIVSQTNFHVVPLMNKAHHPNKKSKYWMMFQSLEWDIRNRALKLGRLGLFPRMFGQDMSKVFKQKYHGNLTIVPRFTTMQTFGLQALSNPTVEDMKVYLKYGSMATWFWLNTIRDMIRLEKDLDDCLNSLEARLAPHSNMDGDWSAAQDDVESIASGSSAHFASQRVRIVGRPPVGLNFRNVDGERMRKRVIMLEQENKELRKELEKIKQNVQKDSSGGIRKTEDNNDGDSAPPNMLSDQAEESQSLFDFVLRNKQ
jgi:predicted acylesterase/phospholipase RssA